MKRIERNAKRKQTHLGPETKVYRTFESNLERLAYFVGTTESHYEKQVRILRRQVRIARRELPQVEMQLGKLMENMGRSIKGILHKESTRWLQTRIHNNLKGVLAGYLVV